MAKLKQDEGLFQDAFDKYDAALKIKPDKHEALNNWGNALLELFHLTGRVDHLARAEELYRRAEQIERGSGAYNLACALALQERDEEALDWLAKAIEHEEMHKTLARDDADLKSLRSLDRFKVLTG